MKLLARTIVLPSEEGLTETSVKEVKGVTLRAVLVGLFVVVSSSLLSVYIENVIHSSKMAYGQMPMSVLMVFVVLLMGTAFIFKAVGPRWALSSSEWLTILCMGLIAGAIPTYGLSGYLIGLMASPYYFAAPENGWAAYVHPRLPSWLIPTNRGEAITWFYEGAPDGALIPWDVWVLPLLWWSCIIVAVGFALTCVAVILRRPWAQDEKLAYPALSPEIEMAIGVGSGHLLPGVMRERLFWVGFWITFGILCWNTLPWFYLGFPRIPINPHQWIQVGRHIPPLLGTFSPFVICFSYFASLDVLFSIWFFDLLFVVESGILSRIGSGTPSAYATGEYQWQTTGAFMLLVLWRLWVVRRHLRDVVRKAFNSRCRVDDSGEMLSYRTCLFGLILSTAYIILWLHQVGVDYAAALVLVILMFIIYIGIARVVAEAGLVYVTAPSVTWKVALAFLGESRSLSEATLTGFALSSVVTSHFNGLFMPPLTHAARLSDLISGDRKRIFWAISLAFVVGLISSVWITICFAYRDGAYNLQSWPIERSGREAIDSLASGIKSPKSFDTVNFYFFGIGMAFMTMLSYLRYRFIWWPFHSIGFALSGTLAARKTSATIFFAWMLKLVMLKLGGPSFYRRLKPFFIGLLTGYILGVGASAIVDIIWFPGAGHEVHRWF